MIPDTDRWRGFAALLPPADAEYVEDCVSIGEQEAALGRLVAGLLEHRPAISEAEWATIAATAEAWDTWPALGPGLTRCLDLCGGGTSLTVIGDSDADALPGSAVADGPLLAELHLVPWIGCARCEAVLARAHRREPWGGLSHLAAGYVVLAPHRAAPARVHGPEAVDEAVAALRAVCGGEHGPAAR
ncbi:hypothetical protein [Actinacidiphila sp. bgisy160]|uniref:hypothetical protein n=1 Tax=Actinacidiphila sp. bgisy160 TaxID=3413796 RepID=UPI003D703877